MADEESILYFQAGAGEVTGADSVAAARKNHPDARAAGEIRLVEDIYAGAPMQHISSDDPHERLKFHAQILDQLKEIDRHRFDGNVYDRYEGHGLPATMLYGLGVAIHEDAAKTGDYKLYEEYLKYADKYDDTDGIHNGYAQWFYPKYVQFIQVLEADPVLSKAEAHWASLSQQDKLKLANYVHNIQAGIFDFLPDEIRGADLRAEKINGGRDNLTITLDSAGPLFSRFTFGQFMNIVTHEGTHTLQGHLVTRFMQICEIEAAVLDQMHLGGYDDLKTNDQKAEFQKLVQDKITESGLRTPWDHHLGFYGDFAPHVWKLMLPYVDSKVSFGAYERHPRETEADGVGQDMDRSLTGPPRDRQRQVELIQSLADIINRNTNGEPNDPPDSYVGLGQGMKPFSFLR